MMNLLSPTLVPSGQAESQDRHSSPSRIPTLDGWRGIAIGLVLFDHIQFALLHKYAWPWTQTGHHGVTIFFVLSGFLITSKLIEDPIDLKRFYVRRFFRLMPVAWAYLAAMILFHLLAHWPVAPPAAILGSLFFFRNYVIVDGGSATWHFWSLSVEEQFYLVWPCALFFGGIRRCRWIAIAGAAGCALFRFTHWAQYDHDIIDCQTQVRADALLVGCLLALFMNDPKFRSIAVRWSKTWAFPAFGFLIFCIYRFSLLPPLTECICIAALMAASVLNPASIFARPLSSRMLVQLGILSYSIYVWQEIFMLLAPSNGKMGLVMIFIAMPLCAYASYEYLERPLNRLGHKLTQE